VHGEFFALVSDVNSNQFMAEASVTQSVHTPRAEVHAYGSRNGSAGGNDSGGDAMFDDKFRQGRLCVVRCLSLERLFVGC